MDYFIDIFLEYIFNKGECEGFWMRNDVFIRVLYNGLKK